MMNLADYFNPSEVLPHSHGLPKNHSVFGKLSKKGVSDVGLIDSKSLVIFGVKESRNSNNRGAEQAPDLIRKYFYSLSGTSLKGNLIDLGNLKQTEDPANSYMAIRDVTTHLIGKGATVIVLGGTQEITWPLYQALQEHQKPINLSLIDYTIDMGTGDGDFSSTCFVERLLEQNHQQLFDLNIIGYQGYLTNEAFAEKIKNQDQSLYRLGYVRGAMSQVEPAIRDSHLVSLDMGAVRQSDSPGTVFPSPNGFYAEEVCQLARYAGLSERVKVFGLFELNSNNDPQFQSAHLAAQIIWHFAESVYQRERANKIQEYKKYYVSTSIPEVVLKFFHNPFNDKWCVEVPGNENHGEPYIMACSYDDYRQAGAGNPPERWLRAARKISGIKL